MSAAVSGTQPHYLYTAVTSQRCDQQTDVSFSANWTSVTVSKTFLISELTNWVLEFGLGFNRRQSRRTPRCRISVPNWTNPCLWSGGPVVWCLHERDATVNMFLCAALQPTFICAPAAQAVRQRHPRPAHNSTLLGSDKAAEGGLQDRDAPSADLTGEQRPPVAPACS